MPVPSAVVDRVRDATDIVEIIGGVIDLKRSGSNLKGLCPFHQEKTPSFMVSPSKQLYHCFGCGQGGNVFTFLMEYEKLSFGEVLERLAERAGIELPKAPGGPAGESERIYQALEYARDFYRRALAASVAEEARRYLSGRGLEPPTIESFGLGYAPQGWSTFLDRAKKTLPERTLESAGLVIAKTSGGHYDRFRNRLMIPIVSPGGRTVAFGARALTDADTPKYLNSPETSVYRKGSALFGLPQARAALRERGEMLLVEGYMDVMSLHEAGFAHAVGCCGTALTVEQVRLARRYVTRLVLLFDGDSAGRVAARRALSVVLAEGVAASVVLLPGGLDPDAFVRSHGADAMEALLQTRLDAVEFVETLQATPASQMTVEDALHALRDLLSVIPDPIARRLLVQKAAERFRFPEETLAAEVERTVRGGRRLGPARKEQASPVPEGDRRPSPGWPSGFERDILVRLALEPALLPRVYTDLQEGPIGPGTRQALECLRRLQDAGSFEVSRALEGLDDPGVRSIVSEALLSEAAELQDDEKEHFVDDVRRWSAASRILAEIREVEVRINQGEGARNPDLVRRRQRLQQALSDCRSGKPGPWLETERSDKV